MRSVALEDEGAVGDGRARSADGLAVGDYDETDARRRLSSCAPPNFNLNAEDAEIDVVLFVEPTVEIGWDRIFLLF